MLTTSSVNVWIFCSTILNRKLRDVLRNEYLAAGPDSGLGYAYALWSKYSI